MSRLPHLKKCHAFRVIAKIDNVLDHPCAGHILGIQKVVVTVTLA